MNILLSSLYHISSYVGGNEQYTHHLALGLVKAGHRVWYLTSKAEPNASYPYKLIIHKVPHMLGKPLLTRAWFMLAEQLNPDILHCTGSGLALLTLAYRSKLAGIPSVLTYQGDTHPSSLALKVPAVLEHALIPRVFNALITTTPKYETTLKKNWPAKRISFIPMMVNPGMHKVTGVKKPAHRRGKYLVLFVGALSSHQYYKGVEVLLSAMEHTPANYVLQIIGTGNKKPYYERMVREKKLKDKVIFLGQVADEQLAGYMHDADVLVLPSTSDSEGFGLVLIEAMTCHTPTVTTTAIGPASWYKEEGITTLVPPYNPLALAKAIVYVTTHDDKKRLNKAYEFANQFTVENMTEQTVKYYQEVIKHAKKLHPVSK